MKLICTIQQGNLTVADGSALSHRLYFDFVTRIGIDGKDGITPHVGPDGNWWIGTQNTNIPAEGLRSFQTYHNFPTSEIRTCCIWICKPANYIGGMMNT